MIQSGMSNMTMIQSGVPVYVENTAYIAYELLWADSVTAITPYKVINRIIATLYSIIIKPSPSLLEQGKVQFRHHFTETAHNGQVPPLNRLEGVL